MILGESMRHILRLKENVDLNINTKFRQIKYLNNIVDQDHRFIKKIIKLALGFKSFNTARKTLKRIEAFHMIREGQIEDINRSALVEIEFINKLFGLVA